MQRTSNGWRPHPGPQETFHASEAFEVFYGGAAGGGKSESLLIEALRYVHIPGYTAIIFRRTFPELKQARGLIERSREYYPLLGGKYNEQTHAWRFPHDNKQPDSLIVFGHMEHEKDKYNHQSAEYAYVGFDELTTFAESQYLYLFSRARTTLDIPVRVRAASNPGNEGHEWVKKRFIERLKPYEVRYFIQRDEEDIEVDADYPGALTRQFIPATLADNPTLLEKDPGYRSRLQALSFIDRERLLHGSWDVLVEGNVFKPPWFRRIDRAPNGLSWVRYWDLAGTTKTYSDFTASAAMAVDEDANVYIKDMIRVKQDIPAVHDLMRMTFRQESDYFHGIEKGMFGNTAFQILLAEPEFVGIHIDGIDVKRDKLTRAMPLSVRAEQGKVYLVDGPWVDSFLLEASLFDGLGKTHDDQVDTATGGLQMLAAPLWREISFMSV